MAVKQKKTGFFRRILRIVLRTVLVLFILHFVYLLLLKWVWPPVTITQLNSWIAGDGLLQENRSLDEISPDMALAVIAAEDQRFAEHRGFDWESIAKAMEYNQNNPEHPRGASTISQQTAKNVFLWQGRSWFRKGLEVYSTFLIELIWGKRRILEMYLNVAQTGRGIYGVEAAANQYFNKSAGALSSQEAAKIAACLPNPSVYSVAKPGPYVKRRTRWVLKQMSFLRPVPNIQSIIRP